jgi:hypothetical protein
MKFWCHFAVRRKQSEIDKIRKISYNFQLFGYQEMTLMSFRPSLKL